MKKTFDFGAAIKALKNGKRVTRTGWNGKGMYLFIVTLWKPLRYGGEILIATLREPSPFIAMKTADQGIVPWFASQTDMLATDWMISE